MNKDKSVSPIAKEDAVVEPSNSYAFLNTIYSHNTHAYIYVQVDSVKFLIFFQIFDGLRKERPGFASQLVAVRGDVTLENLGLTPEDRSLLEKKVSVVFHCAANVRFDQKLKDAVSYNTLGTKRVLQLAEGMDNLDVSTG
jgi:hypothetical protein